MSEFVILRLCKIIEELGEETKCLKRGILDLGTLSAKQLDDQAEEHHAEMAGCAADAEEKLSGAIGRPSGGKLLDTVADVVITIGQLKNESNGSGGDDDDDGTHVAEVVSFCLGCGRNLHFCKCKEAD